ncbi:hypothetical protein GCM10011613_21950 [Cellvibrio zantedeschiae]|uniref:Lipoprotein n=1 Tax=Cellvibrio zantedeschiae TaxID=1237077 RepID=A0ABQ3B3W4_9GAMM|nr:hypothetical protein [Cellvibrio zantedeschiae]GGY77046.1 hypothetical protein GCM10011613_21950 [Cellvibrio zantedeschiae]
MNKLLSTPLAVAVSAAFIMTVGLSSCAATPTKETATTQQSQTPEDAARAAAEKKKADEKKRARSMRALPSGGCGH